MPDSVAGGTTISTPLSSGCRSFPPPSPGEGAPSALTTQDAVALWTSFGRCTGRGILLSNCADTEREGISQRCGRGEGGETDRKGLI